MRFLFEVPKYMDDTKGIRLLICDVDGVFSDGLIFRDQGEEYKAFNTKDGP